jgi:hypothetical protein
MVSLSELERYCRWIADIYKAGNAAYAQPYRCAA